DHLVEHEERAGGATAFLEPLQESVDRCDQTHVRGDWLDEQRRDVGPVAVEGLVDCAVVVERHHHGVSDGPLGPAPRPPQPAPPPRPGAARRRQGPGAAPATFPLFARPVAPRARGIAVLGASVPDDPSRTLSTLATRDSIASASSTSRSVGAPYDVPADAARAT